METETNNTQVITKSACVYISNLFCLYVTITECVCHKRQPTETKLVKSASAVGPECKWWIPYLRRQDGLREAWRHEQSWGGGKRFQELVVEKGNIIAIVGYSSATVLSRWDSHSEQHTGSSVYFIETVRFFLKIRTIDSIISESFCRNLLQFIFFFYLQQLWYTRVNYLTHYM